MLTFDLKELGRSFSGKALCEACASIRSCGARCPLRSRYWVLASNPKSPLSLVRTLLSQSIPQQVSVNDVPLVDLWRHLTFSFSARQNPEEPPGSTPPTQNRCGTKWRSRSGHFASPRGRGATGGLSNEGSDVCGSKSSQRAVGIWNQTATGPLYDFLTGFLNTCGTQK